MSQTFSSFRKKRNDILQDLASRLLLLIFSWFTFFQWDLVCGDSFIASMTQAIFIASQGVGAVIFTIISDRTGRKPVLISVLAITLFLAVGVGFSASAPAFIVLRSVLGAVSEVGVALVAVDGEWEVTLHVRRYVCMYV